MMIANARGCRGEGEARRGTPEAKTFPDGGKGEFVKKRKETGSTSRRRGG